MTTLNASRLILGGHSFIAELGNDDALSYDQQVELVAACLDAGINTFDTTYEPERIALGKILNDLNRRDEARIIIWNFFIAEDGKHITGPKPYAAEHLSLFQEQLFSNHIDALVVHPINDEEDSKQIALAKTWQENAAVSSLGVWGAGANPQERFGADNPFSFAVMPCNIANPHSDQFAASKAMGWSNLATSPFNRGYLLDKMCKIAGETERDRVAAAMLRFSAFSEHIDHVIIGLRKTEWITVNLSTIAQGPLDADELKWLQALYDEAKQADAN